jgi:hypothetical protein
MVRWVIDVRHWLSELGFESSKKCVGLSALYTVHNAGQAFQSCTQPSQNLGDTFYNRSVTTGVTVAEARWFWKPA